MRPSTVSKRQRAPTDDKTGDLFAALVEPVAARPAPPRAHPKAGHIGFDKDGRFVHFCACGRWASYGVGVAIKEGSFGTWFCSSACKPS